MKTRNFNKGALLGSVLGISLGVVAAQNMKRIPKRKILRTVKKAKSNVMNGVNSLWG